MTKWRVFADRTKALLEERGMTQRELAEQVGVTEVSISRYMSGSRIPKATVIVNFDELMKLKKESGDFKEDNQDERM